MEHKRIPYGRQTEERQGINGMSGRLKLKISKKLRGNGYWAHLGERDEMDFERVLEEAARNSTFSPNMLRLAFETVMDSMIEGTLKDGISRTAGDYFKLRLDVRGTFDSPYDYFDEDKHELALNLQALKGLKRLASPSLVERPYVPVVLDSISNPDGEEGLVDITKPILIRGKRLKVNLDVVDEGVDMYTRKSPRGKSVSDLIFLTVRCRDGEIYSYTLSQRDIAENDSSHILIRLPDWRGFEEMWDHKPYLLEAEVDSCGGDPSARRQQHTIKAKILPKE